MDNMASCDFTRTCSYRKSQISSVNFPGEYLKRSTCYWTITSDLGTYISLVFHSFDIPSLGECDSSSLTVSNGQDEEGDVFCNSQYPPMFPVPILSNFNALYLKFQTGAEDAGTGFLAEYEQAKRSLKINVTQGRYNLTHQTSVVTSHDFFLCFRYIEGFLQVILVRVGIKVRRS